MLHFWSEAFINRNEVLFINKVFINKFYVQRKNFKVT
jgi:hypothetical protein